MAKHYTTVVVEGRSLAEVESCLGSIIGPLLQPWRDHHILGVHLDITDVSAAVRYGMEFENKDAPTPSYPVVEIDFYARSDLPTRALERHLGEIVAAGISERLGVTARIRTSD